MEAKILPDDFTQYDLSFKLIIIGDSGVGKSCLTLKATKNTYTETHSPTVGVEFGTFNVRIAEKNIKLQIWDTCGQEVYKALISSFYKNAGLAIMVYAINDEKSFDSLEAWLNEIKTQSSPEVKIFLIGNKADLEEKRKVKAERAENFVKENRLDYFCETSAKTGFNAQNVFVRAAQVLYEEHLKYKDRSSRPGSMLLSQEPELEQYILGENEKSARRKKGCC